MIPAVVAKLLVTLTILCQLQPLEPEVPDDSAVMTPAVISIDELDEVEMLACVIYQEAGGDECSDECRMYVGDVVLNRIMDSRFPDTMEEVLTQRAQYGRFYWTGIVWPSRAQNAGEAHAVERAYDIARKLLSGEHSKIYGEGYVWQAEFEQGSEGFWCDGMFFGR